MPATSRIAAINLTLGLAALMALAAVWLATPAHAATPVYADAAGSCAGLTPCYTTIQEAVDNAGPAPAEVFVFPGTYAESVDLGDMGSAIAGALGDITLTTVDAAGSPSPGTASVEPASGDAFVNSVSPFPGNIAIDGFAVTSPNDQGFDLDTGSGSITLSNVTVSDNGDGAGDDDGANLNSVSGDISITDSSATNTDGDGFQMGTGGNVTVSGSTANNNGIDADDQGFDIGGSPSSVTIDGSTANGNMDAGFLVTQAGTVTITDSTANNNADHGVIVGQGSNVTSVTITSSSADSNDDDGFNTHATVSTSVSDSSADDNGDEGFDLDDSIFGGPGSGTITITNSHASGNGTALDGDDNFELDAGGTMTVSDSSATGAVDDDGFDFDGGGSVTITNTTSNDNADEGFEIDTSGSATLDGVTANNNADDGVDLESFEEDVQDGTVTNSLFIGNGGAGYDIDSDTGGEHDPAGSYSLADSIVCGNLEAGLEQNSDVTTDATGTWWGDGSGPSHPDNAGGGGDAVIDGNNPLVVEEAGLGTADFDPWIDAISGSADAATLGAPTVVSFEFSGGSGAVALQEGPGDPNGDPVFTATTDNGTVSTGGLVSGGVLEVTLTPESVGTATVTIEGPCGLDDTLGGNSITLDVTEAPAEGTPTATATPSDLPDTGGPPAGGDGVPWLGVAALLAAAAALSGGAVALRKARR